MRLLFRIFFVLPVALLLLLFAIANREFVKVSFDPFPGNDIAGPEITAPLFLVLMLAGLTGLLVGGFVVWMRQRRWRREARLARMDANNARAEADRLRSDLLAARAPTPGLAASSLAQTGTALVVRRDAA